MGYVVALTSEDLEFGKRLTDALNKARFPFRGIFWLYDESADDWRLVVATDLVSKEGPRKTYLRLAEITSKLPAADYQLLKLSLIPTEDPVYQALSSVFAPAKSVEGARLSHTNVGGIVIPEAYLYQIR